MLGTQAEAQTRLGSWKSVFKHKLLRRDKRRYGKQEKIVEEKSERKRKRVKKKRKNVERRAKKKTMKLNLAGT